MKRKISVFIASPGDPAAERRRFKEIINDLNAGFGDGANVEFVPLGWEDTLALTGRRSQGVINQEIDKCDVFILTLYRRWGQEAPDAAPYSSYTEEEFYRALERWKKEKSPEIFVFFKRVDAASEGDPDPELQKVMKFKSQLKEKWRVFPRYFDDENGFVKEVNCHLRTYAKGEQPEPDSRIDKKIFPLEVLEELEKMRAEVAAKYGK